MGMAQLRRSAWGVMALLAAALAGCGLSPTSTAASSHQSHVSQARNSDRVSASDSLMALRAKPRKSVSHLSRPTPANPLKALVIGDSLGEDLQYGLADVAGSTGSIRIIEGAYGSSGLVNVSYYNWDKVFARDLATYHPQLVYVLFGGNDSLSFDQGGQFVTFGSALWRRDYGARVNFIITEAERAKARVIWVGLPIMSRSSDLSNARMVTLNALYRAEVAKHPEMAVFVPTWKLFRNSSGGFTEYMTDSAGETVMVRDPDGVHIAPPAGDELIASDVLYQTERLEKVSLCLSGSDLWSQYPMRRCPTRP